MCPHTGLSQRAFPEGEILATASTSHNVLTTTPSAVRYESGTRANALFLLDNNQAETNDCLCQSRSLDSAAWYFAQQLVSLRFAGPQLLQTSELAHGSCDTAPLSRESASSALNIHLREVCLRDSPHATVPGSFVVPLPDSIESRTLLEWHRHLCGLDTQQNHPSWMKLVDPSWVDSQMDADNLLKSPQNCVALAS